ncbi:hypothetical protein AB0D67_29710 [Streptosporangium sp. NPDC048047]|uniref:hypothetical protein n=1 Tax=Streptosporangium sp. NPDC048047 TaxID=3155748 RepID=UPI00344208C0
MKVSLLPEDEDHDPAAIDAMRDRGPGPVTVLTSDPEDLAVLCGREAVVVKV